MSGSLTVTEVSGTVTVSAGPIVLGKSSRALELREGSRAPVIYVPRDDIDMSLLALSKLETSCPWKGKASYYSVTTPTGTLTDAVWSYENPLPEVARIAGHLAFYPDRISVTRG